MPQLTLEIPLEQDEELKQAKELLETTSKKPSPQSLYNAYQVLLSRDLDPDTIRQLTRINKSLLEKLRAVNYLSPQLKKTVY